MKTSTPLTLQLSLLLLSTACAREAAPPQPVEAAPAPVAESAAPTAEATAFDQTFELQGVSFRVSGGDGQVTIEPTGLEIDNSVVVRAAQGAITGAEAADLDADSSPEIYVYLRAGEDERGEMVAYAANRKKSLSEIYLPPIQENVEASKGYRGHDEFAVVELTLVRRFPVFEELDGQWTETGTTRQLQYKLAPGEAGWLLTVDKVVEY
jgi:hypothetical protein